MAQRKLTVLQMLPALNAGGVERGTLEVAEALVREGHRALVMSSGGRMVPALQALGAEHIEWPVQRKSLWTLRLVKPLRRLLETRQIDIIHARSRVPAWVAWLAWRGMDPATRPRFVTTVHGPYSVNAYSAVMTRGERVIAISTMIVDYIRQHYPKTDAARIRLIYRGVDPQRYHPGFRPAADWLARWQQEHPHLQGKRLLLLPARLTRWKGQTDFIDLLARLVLHRPDIHGLIVGETHPRKRTFLDELQQRAAQAGIDEQLSFLGHRADIQEIMAISDIVYSLSREPEAFGRVSLEALSLGRPVIAYNHGGVGEQMAALLPEGAVATGDLARATELTRRWLDTPPAPAENHRFTLARMLDATLAVYAELCAEKPATTHGVQR
jgi:glycosyltransferase involved in cell wall biosynthesis